MNEILFHYHKVNPTSWAYLSSLLMIGLYFKFNRFLSVRNLDLVLLILLAPGLLLVHYGSEGMTKAQVEVAALQESLAASTDASQPDPLTEPEREPTAAEMELEKSRSVKRLGFIWLLAVTVIIVIRLLVDPTMVRRPLLEPNLSTGGLAFLGCSLFVFVMANVLTGTPTEDDLQGPRSAEQLMQRTATDVDKLRQHGPGYAVMSLFPSIATMPLMDEQDAAIEEVRYAAVAKMMAIVSHFFVVVGIVIIGYRHFENMRTGIGAATLYLMLPYTATMTGRVDHAIPAALLVWAIVTYRRPLTSGIFLGLATGVVYYPIFLLPLWISFYWQRGLGRFITGVLSTLALMVLSLVLVSPNVSSFWDHVQHMFGLWGPQMQDLEGIWGLGWDPIFRLPILTAFVALCCTFAMWPAQKNLGTLLSCSAAVLAASQLWHAHGGGLFMAWYLPLVLLTIFRPNLEDRIALSVLGEGWFFGQRNPLGKQAA